MPGGAEDNYDDIQYHLLNICCMSSVLLDLSYNNNSNNNNDKDKDNS